jgi:very-short-patch-repair endonuclease
MIKIYVDGKQIVEKKKETHKKVFLIFADGTKRKYGEIKRVDVECDKCNKRNNIGIRSDIFKRKDYFCFSCNHLKERNHFYGKHHTKETKEKISLQKKGKPSKNKGRKHTGRALENMRNGFKRRDQKGSKNPFWGKKHTKETKEKIVQSRLKTMSKWSVEQKQELREKQSKGQKKLMERNPEKYRQNKVKACRESHKSQGRYKINKIETKILNELKERGMITFKYSVILGYNQYDFGCKRTKILLEVHGDYWHCNPRIYAKPINDMQIMKRARDLEKQQFAEKNGFKLFTIWEDDIKNNNLSTLEELKKYYEIQIKENNKKNT